MKVVIKTAENTEIVMDLQPELAEQLVAAGIAKKAKEMQQIGPSEIKEEKKEEKKNAKKDTGSAN